MSDQIQKVYILSFKLDRVYFDGYELPEEERIIETSVHASSSDAFEASKIKFENIFDKYILELFRQIMKTIGPDVFYTTQEHLFVMREKLAEAENLESLNKVISELLYSEYIGQNPKEVKELFFGCVIGQPNLAIDSLIGVNMIYYSIEEKIVGDMSASFLDKTESEIVARIIQYRNNQSKRN